METREHVNRERVAAVVVAAQHDLSYLCATLDALEAQTHPADEIIVGVSSLESVAAQALADRGVTVVSVPEARNFATALAEMWEKTGLAANDSVWLWFLHADSAPMPQALDRLLRVGENSPKTVAIGPKQIAWRDEPPTLLEVGINATRSARRVPEIERDERDQGQLDSRSDVLAVGTAGMLVKKAALVEVGGLNPDFGPFGDGLELSRRLRHAGYRIVVEPTAIIRHARASLTKDLSDSFGARRLAQLRNGMIAAPSWLVPLLWLWYPVLGVIRSLVRLLFKEPGYVKGELVAGFGIWGSLGIVRKARHQVRQVSAVPRSALADLEATPAQVRYAKRESARSRSEARAMADQPGPLVLKARADLRRYTRRGAIITITLAVLVSIIFFLPVLGTGQIVGGSLAYGQSTAGDIWRAIYSGWIPSGDGYAGAVDPLWVLLLPILTIGNIAGLTLGHLTSAIMVLAIPVTAYMAYRAIGIFTRQWVVRTVLAILWACNPFMFQALAEGRFAGVIVATLLPAAFLCLLKAWRNRWGYAGALALVLALLSAAMPSFLILTVVLSLIGVIRGHGSRLRWAAIAAPAILVYLPVFYRLRASDIPDFFFATLGVPQTSFTDVRAIPGFEWSAEPNLNWLIIGAALALICAAVFALFRNTNAGIVRFGWLCVALGISWSIVAPHAGIGIAPDFAGDVTTPWLGFGLLLTWSGLIVCTAAGADSLRTRLRRRNFGVAHVVAFSLSLLVLLAVPAMPAYYLINHFQEESPTLLRTSADPLPAVAIEEQRKGNSVLVLNAEQDGISADLWRAEGAQLTDYSALRNLRMVHEGHPKGHEHLAQAIANATAGSTEASAQLAAHGVAVILIPATGSDRFDDALQAQLSAVSGLEYVTANESGRFWRIPNVSRVMLDGAEDIQARHTGAHGTVEAALEDRVLSLAQKADPHWRARIGGSRLEPTGEAWNQQFTVPANAAGVLRVEYRDWTVTSLGIVQVLTVLLTAVAALPIRRREGGIE